MTVHGILGLGGAKRIVVRFLFAAAAALAIPAAMFVAPVPANADGPLRICEAFGNHYCLGSDNVGLFTPVVERVTGREIDRHFIGGSVGGFPAIRLELNADRSKCVAVGNNLHDVVIHACNDTGTVWGLRTESHDRYLNRLTGKYLSGHNQSGSQYFVAALDTTGAFQRFNIV